MSSPIRPAIRYKGQPYVDEPVHVEPRPPDPLAYAVACCFYDRSTVDRRVPPRIQVAWQQVRLNWIKP